MGEGNLNNNGGVIWKKEFKKYFYTHLSSSCALDSGGVIGYGEYSIYDNYYSGIRWLFSINDQGDFDWEIKKDDPGISYSSVNKTLDGNYVLLESDSISKFNQKGSFFYIKSSSQLNIFERCLPTMDYGLIVGESNNIYKINSEGIIEWSKKVNDYYDLKGWCMSLATTSDNNYLLSGNILDLGFIEYSGVKYTMESAL